MDDTTRRVWIGCLACYNGGRLVGAWHEASEAGDITPEQLHGAPTDHEELWVMDLDNFPSGTGEMSPCEAQRIDEALTELEDSSHVPAAAVAAYADNMGTPVWELDASDVDEAYQGEYSSREDFAQELADDLGLVPDEQPWPLSYIDWERAARDLFMDYYDAPAPGGMIYVFRSI